MDINIKFAALDDLYSWMELIRLVSWNFPGLETEDELCYEFGYPQQKFILHRK